MDNNAIEVKVTSVEMVARTDLEAVIYDLNKEIELLSSQADKWDYLVAVASGILCGMLDIIWVGDFSLENGRAFARDKVDGFVEKTAKILGFKDDDLKDAVKFLEEKFPMSSDGNTSDFGGGLQHHLRDFAHHPTIVGLIFSLLTQFTGISYGTDVNGVFKVVPVPDKSKAFIGKDIPDKLFKGTVVWFFHLVSDMAGSSSTAGITGGTGIPGPILSLAKELSALPIFKNMKIGDNKLSVFLSKLFNGTIFAQHDENGKIIKDTVIKFDLRGELGAVAELGKQALPVIANDCIVRSFYFIRRFSLALKSLNCSSIGDIRLKDIDWDSVKPFDNPTITRMLTISSAVFSTVDITEAVISQKYFVSVNYVGVGRFAVAIGSEITNYLKVRNVKRIKQMYEDIRRNTFTETDNNVYNRISVDMNAGRFNLSPVQVEILYNLEMLKTMNDIEQSTISKELKQEWLEEWKQFMSIGFSDFVGIPNAVLHWYSKKALIQIIESNDPKQVWFRLVLLEAMLFTPYYPISMNRNSKGDELPSKKYKILEMPFVHSSQSSSDEFLDSMFEKKAYYQTGYISRLRKSYNRIIRELNEVLKSILKGVGVMAIIAIPIIIGVALNQKKIAQKLVGSKFSGLRGIAKTNACLSYLGGGAVAKGGKGIAGGVRIIIGGGAILGIGLGAGTGGAVTTAEILGKKGTILESAKLMVAVQEIFLNDEHDLEYSNTIYEQYVQNISDIEKGLVELRLKADVASKKEREQFTAQIENTEEAVEVMKKVMHCMNKFNSSFAVGESVSE